MRVILSILRALFYLVALLIFTLVALRFTLDANSLSPDIAKVISERTGAEVEVKGVELAGVTGLSIAVVDLVFPYSPEREAEWKEYDIYLKKRDLAKREGGPSPEPMSEPLPMLNVCAHNTLVTFDTLSLWSFVTGGDVRGELATNLFECAEYDDPPQPSTAGLLKATFNAPVDSALGGPKPPSERKAKDVEVQLDLSELNLGSNEVLIDKLPIKVSGALSLHASLQLRFGRRGRFQLRKSLGDLELEVADLSTDKGTIQGFELPPLKFGQLTATLKLEQGGKLMFRQFESKSADLDIKLTGHLSLSMVLARLGLNTHIALNLNADLLRRHPDLKMIAKQGARMARGKAHIKEQSDGGYEIATLVNGKARSPRFSGKVKSPYGEDGRRLSRSKSRAKRDTKRAKKPNRRSNSRIKRSTKRRGAQARPSASSRDRGARAKRAKRPNKRRPRRNQGKVTSSRVKRRSAKSSRRNARGVKADDLQDESGGVEMGDDEGGNEDRNDQEEGDEDEEDGEDESGDENSEEGNDDSEGESEEDNGQPEED